MKNFILICIILFSVRLLFAWDSTSAKYYPFAVGNSWNYLVQTGSTCGLLNSPIRDKVTITGTEIHNGHVYFIFVNYNYKYRIDSISGNLVLYELNGCQWMLNERLTDSLASQSGDHYLYDCRFPFLCFTSSENVCGGIRPVKTFEGYYTLGQLNYHDIRKYAENIGKIFVESSFTHPQGGSSCIRSTLIGSVINGVVCGDTNVYTGIEPITNEIPVQFFLFQNSPNPFNPVTNIKFNIPKTPLNPLFNQKGEERSEGGFVKFIIYDIVGKEIETLIKEKLSPGTYEIEWNAADYPSGVYYYRLTASEFTETKKMVLIK